MKICSSCKLLLNHECFNKNKGRKDGVAVYCKVCEKAYRVNRVDKTAVARTQKWQKANPEKYLLGKKATRINYKDKNAASQKKYLAENPGIRKAYRATNAIKIAAQASKYQKSNLDNLRISSQKRRAKLAGNGLYKVTASEIQKLLLRPCAYCDEKSEHIDHIIPVSRGGTHSIGNLIGACAYCNQSKNAKFITEWNKVKQTKGKEHGKSNTRRGISRTHY